MVGHGGIRAAELIGWKSAKPEGHGRGIALGIKSGPTTGLSHSLVRLLADGSVVVYAGTQDIGQGARTVFAQICAEELGVAINDVSVVMGDTATVPYDQQTSASRSTVLMGNAIILACRDIRKKLMEKLGDDYDADQAVSWHVGLALGAQGGEIIGTGESRKVADDDHPLGGSALFFEFNATAVEVSVDEQTGDITMYKHVAVSDVGKSINRLQVQMQDEGAAIMGLGHTLMEHYIFDATGRIRTWAPSTTASQPQWTCPKKWSAIRSRTWTARVHTAQRACPRVRCCLSRRPWPPPFGTLLVSRFVTCHSRRSVLAGASRPRRERGCDAMTDTLRAGRRTITVTHGDRLVFSFRTSTRGRSSSTTTVSRR